MRPQNQDCGERGIYTLADGDLNSQTAPGWNECGKSLEKVRDAIVAADQQIKRILKSAEVEKQVVTARAGQSIGSTPPSPVTSGSQPPTQDTQVKQPVSPTVPTQGSSG